MIIRRGVHYISCSSTNNKDPIHRKKVFTDPKIISKKREIYRKLIHISDIDITRDELKTLTKEHQLRIRCNDNKLYLQILPEKWKNDETWSIVTNIINEFKMISAIREELSDIPDNIETSIWIPLEMEFIGEDLPYNDWIDHA